MFTFLDRCRFIWILLILLNGSVQASIMGESSSSEHSDSPANGTSPSLPNQVQGKAPQLKPNGTSNMQGPNSSCVSPPPQPPSLKPNQGGTTKPTQGGGAGGTSVNASSRSIKEAEGQNATGPSPSGGLGAAAPLNSSSPVPQPTGPPQSPSLGGLGNATLPTTPSAANGTSALTTIAIPPGVANPNASVEPTKPTPVMTTLAPGNGSAAKIPEVVVTQGPPPPPAPAEAVGGCADESALCVYWSVLIDECGGPTNCKATCTSCMPKQVKMACVDNDLNCPIWASRGECHRNPYFMVWNCAKACSWCQTSGYNPMPNFKDLETAAVAARAFRSLYAPNTGPDKGPGPLPSPEPAKVTTPASGPGMGNVTSTAAGVTSATPKPGQQGPSAGNVTLTPNMGPNATTLVPSPQATTVTPGAGLPVAVNITTVPANVTAHPLVMVTETPPGNFTVAASTIVSG